MRCHPPCPHYPLREWEWQRMVFLGFLPSCGARSWGRQCCGSCSRRSRPATRAPRCPPGNWGFPGSSSCRTNTTTAVTVTQGPLLSIFGGVSVGDEDKGDPIMLNRRSGVGYGCPTPPKNGGYGQTRRNKGGEKRGTPGKVQDPGLSLISGEPGGTVAPTTLWGNLHLGSQVRTQHKPAGVLPKSGVSGTDRKNTHNPGGVPNTWEAR